MDQNNKNNKPGGGKNSGGNWRGFIHLICWALLLTAVVGYAGNYMTNTAHHASSVELEYGAFLELVEAGEVAAVNFDTDEAILLIDLAEGKTYTGEDGTVYTRTIIEETETEPGFDGYTYADELGQERQTTMELFTVQIQSNDTTVAYLVEHGVFVNEDYQPPISPILVFLINLTPFLVIMLVMTLVMSWMAKKGMGGMGGIGGVGKANAKVYMEKSTGVTFRDVAGQDEAKESLTEIIDFLHNPGKYTEIGAKLPKGALLVGPPVRTVTL